jgi:UDP-glucose 4-epimerase
LESNRVIVTGSRGFVAEHTIPALEAAGYEVVGYDLLDGQDICDDALLGDTIQQGDKILHLAAVSRFNDASRNPPEAWRTNVGGTATLLKVAAEKEADRVVMASTGSVYMPVCYAPIMENHPIAGNSHYGCSKAQAEYMLQLHRVPYVILRYAHLYGLNKKHGGLVDAYLERIKRGASPIMFGGFQGNDFTYIADVVQSNLLALETLNVNEAYNIGSGEEITTARAFGILEEITGYMGEIENRTARQVDALHMYMDISKSRRLLGYDPSWSFREGLADLLAKMCHTVPK